MENEIKYSSQKTIIFQVGIIKLCSGEAVSSNNNGNIDNSKIEALNAKINNLEQKILGLDFHKKSSNVENISQNFKNELVNKIENKIPKETLKKPPVNLNIGEKLESWPKIITELKQSGKIMLYTNLINSQASKLNDMTVAIGFPGGLTPFGKTVLEKSENMQELEKRVSIELGKPMKIKLIDEKMQKELAQKPQASEIETLAQNLDLPFNVID